MSEPLGIGGAACGGIAANDEKSIFFASCPIKSANTVPLKSVCVL